MLKRQYREDALDAEIPDEVQGAAVVDGQLASEVVNAVVDAIPGELENAQEVKDFVETLGDFVAQLNVPISMDALNDVAGDVAEDYVNGEGEINESRLLRKVKRNLRAMHEEVEGEGDAIPAADMADIIKKTASIIDVGEDLDPEDIKEDFQDLAAALEDNDLADTDDVLSAIEDFAAGQEASESCDTCYLEDDLESDLPAEDNGPATICPNCKAEGSFALSRDPETNSSVFTCNECGEPFVLDFKENVDGGMAEDEDLGLDLESDYMNESKEFMGGQLDDTFEDPEDDLKLGDETILNTRVKADGIPNKVAPAGLKDHIATSKEELKKRKPSEGL